MATPFSRRWDDAAAGTMDKADVQDRKLYMARFRMDVGTVAFYWSADGTSSGDGLETGSECPMAFATVRDSVGGWSISGGWGPIHDPDDAQSGDLWFIRTEWDSGNSLWKTTVYKAAVDSAGVLIISATARGRDGFAWMLA